MEITTFFLIISAFLLFIMFFPDIFPKCSNCKKIKFRTMFRIHKNVSLRPGYKASKSVCRKCCRKYGIDSLKEYERYENIRKKAEYRLKSKI